MCAHKEPKLNSKKAKELRGTSGYMSQRVRIRIEQTCMNMWVLYKKKIMPKSAFFQSLCETN